MIAMALNEKNINIYPLLIVFLCGPMSFLAHWIVAAPKLGPIINIVFKKFLNMKLKGGYYFKKFNLHEPRTSL